MSKKSQIREINDYQQIHDAFNKIEDNPLEAITTLGDLARQETFRLLIPKHGGIEKVAPFLLNSNNNDILCKACRVFTNLSYENNDNATKIVGFKEDDQVVKRIVSLIAEEELPELRRNAVALCANLVHADGTELEYFFIQFL